MKRIKILSETFSSIKEHLDSNIHQIITSFMDVDENQEGLNRNNIITEFLSKIETYLHGKTAEIYEQKESLAHINPRNYFYNDFMEKLITESLKEGITDDQMNKLNEMVKILKERFEFGMDIGGLKNFLDVSIENNASNKLIEDLQKFCQIAPMDYLLKLGKSYIEISRTKENLSEKEELAKKGIATLKQVIDQSNSPETIRFQTQATGITATCFIFGIGAENSTKDAKERNKKEGFALLKGLGEKGKPFKEAIRTKLQEQKDPKNSEIKGDNQNTAIKEDLASDDLRQNNTRNNKRKSRKLKDKDPKRIKTDNKQNSLLTHASQEETGPDDQNTIGKEKVSPTPNQENDGRNPIQSPTSSPKKTKIDDKEEEVDKSYR